MLRSLENRAVEFGAYVVMKLPSFLMSPDSWPFSGVDLILMDEVLGLIKRKKVWSADAEIVVQVVKNAIGQQEVDT